AALWAGPPGLRRRHRGPEPPGARRAAVRDVRRAGREGAWAGVRRTPAIRSAEVTSARALCAILLATHAEDPRRHRRPGPYRWHPGCAPASVEAAGGLTYAGGRELD